MLARLQDRLFAPTSIAPLVWFRVVFGAVMFLEAVRYLVTDRIERYWIQPAHFVGWVPLDWVEPWPGNGMYVHWVVLGLASLGIAAGLFYRLSAWVFFLGFTQVFLTERSLYLNHFYLICILGFVLAVLPANRYWSLDVKRGAVEPQEVVPAWTVFFLRFQVAVPYVFGAIAKLNADWLAGKPIGRWLSVLRDEPLVGPIFDSGALTPVWIWGGIIFDLLIVPALMWRKTRYWALGAAVVFHLTNAWMFNIGVFPWMMLAASPIYFAWKLGEGKQLWREERLPSGWITAFLVGWVAVQCLLPFRHLVIPGVVGWTEEGHEFSWHMKLRDKQAHADWVAYNPETREVFPLQPYDFFVREQIDELPERPIALAQMARIMRDELERRGKPGFEIRANVYARLNHRPKQRVVDPSVDLASVPIPGWLEHAEWILPIDLDKEDD
jgi:hypothetical protein